MPDFHNPAAFLLLFIIPLLYILRKAGVLTRLTLFATISDWGGKTFEWDVKRRRIFSMISKILCHTPDVMISRLRISTMHWMNALSTRLPQKISWGHSQLNAIPV